MSKKSYPSSSLENQLSEYIFEVVEENFEEDYKGGPSNHSHKVLILAERPGGAPGDFESFLASSLDDWFSSPFSVTLLNPDPAIFGSSQPFRFY